MKKKNVMTMAVTLAAAMVGMVSCSLDMPQETQSSFETMTVKKSDIELPYKFSARMKGQNDVTITPQVSGQLMRICVAEGQQVRRGQLLFVIDSRNAKLELEAAQANLQAALAQENSAKLEYESNKNLFEKNIVSSYMLNNSENQYKQAQAAVAQARASVNRAKVNLGFCSITAPVSGIIGGIPVRPGDQVSPMTELTMLSGNTAMYAEISLPESILESMAQLGIKANEVDEHLAKLPAATFVTKSGTEYPHKGRVVSLSGVVDSSTGSLTCKISFPNPDGHLYSGIQGTIVIPFSEKGVIVIPQFAVVRLQDKAQVYKVKADSTATSVEVKTEDTGNGKEFIVTSGLKVGDRIVTNGANNVTEGQKVLFPKAAKEEKKDK
ncbi:MAG: efflux RND transporter periplasmic adaptor subunit [Prevotella sp.]|nr:efflux RND transporter periplasmic adaptor subunit [Prevotella sp.]